MPPSAPTFDPTLWTPDRALAFARGLYLVAASDGVAPIEAALVERFLEATGGPADLVGLSNLPFDFTDGRQRLDSHWLRRLMVRACRVLAEIEGGLTDPERDALRAMALGLGVGERLALAPASFQPTSPEEVVHWLARQNIDWVSWDDESQPATFWPFPGGAAQLDFGAKILVDRGQALVITREGHGGDVLDVLQDGVHEATPESLPGLAADAGWAEGPVAARLLFVNLGSSELLRWGSVDAITVPSRAGGSDLVPLRAFGRFSARIADARKAFNRFCRNGLPTSDDFESRVRRMAAGRFGEALRALATSEKLGADSLLHESSAVIDRVRPAIERAFTDAGLAIRRFELESLTGPLELELRTTGGGRLLNSGAFANPTQGSAAAAAAPDAALSCHRCLNAVPPNARFCAQCGAPQRKACATCGTDVAVRARFCSQCGGSQSGAIEKLPG